MDSDPPASYFTETEPAAVHGLPPVEEEQEEAAALSPDTGHLMLEQVGELGGRLLEMTGVTLIVTVVGLLLSILLLRTVKL